jgi:hypothetical protein
MDKYTFGGVKMNTKMVSTLAGVALVFGMGSAQAALWDFTLTGAVIYADALNDYNLGEGSLVTVSGVFDDSVLMGGTGTISFASGNAYGNTFTLTAGDITFTPDEEILPNGADYPLLTLNAMAIDFGNGGLNFYATDTGSGATFNSYFGVFDGDDLTNLALISGEWTGYTVTAVPEASTYTMMLAGLGLVGFMGARRKSLRAAA